MNMKKLINSKPPERIWGWLHSPLSLARHYGGITYQGHSYVIDDVLYDPPLVRVDVLEREKKLSKVIRKKIFLEQKAKQQALF
jgi:hypothetical protein